MERERGRKVQGILITNVGYWIAYNFSELVCFFMIDFFFFDYFMIDLKYPIIVLLLEF